jgi:hypothetical protein
VSLIENATIEAIFSTPASRSWLPKVSRVGLKPSTYYRSGAVCFAAAIADRESVVVGENI